MAGGAFFDITLTGKGSHGARPEDGIDPVLTACHLTTALQAIVSRNIKPADTAVLSVTAIQAGDAYNVIPVRRAKARSLCRSQSYPARVAPAGSNRSDEGGNESVEAYDVTGHLVTLRACRP